MGMAQAVLRSYRVKTWRAIHHDFNDSYGFLPTGIRSIIYMIWAYCWHILASSMLSPILIWLSRSVSLGCRCLAGSVALSDGF